jgi:DNA polymerase-3 subunit alpha
MERDFVHLHLHSEYSLLDGGNRLDKLVRRVKELGMSAVAVTDHGNMFGAMAFYEAAKAEGIKPIFGCEAYVAQGERQDRTHTGVKDGGHHLVLLAETLEGYRNLLYLASEAYLTGFYYKPRIDRSLLESHGAGLIAINGHLGSELAFHLVEYEKTGHETHWNEALRVAEWHKQVFSDDGTGPRFYVELQHHVPEQNAINKHLIRLAETVGAPLVCDNDSHFLTADDWDAHDSLICISMGKTKDDPNRLRYPSGLYVKSPEEMRELFEGTYAEIGREACDNTVRIAARCNVKPAFENHAPLVQVVRPGEPLQYAGEADRTTWFKQFCAQYSLEPISESSDASATGDDAIDRRTLEAQCDHALRELCEAGLIWRYGPELASAQPRAEDPRGQADQRVLPDRVGLRELGAQRASRRWRVVRASARWWGTCWACPTRARCGTACCSSGSPTRTGRVPRYRYRPVPGRPRRGDRLRAPKYGHVAQIITFGTLKARAAVRDVCACTRSRWARRTSSPS